MEMAVYFLNGNSTNLWGIYREYFFGGFLKQIQVESWLSRSEMIHNYLVDYPWFVHIDVSFSGGQWENVFPSEVRPLQALFGRFVS